MKKNFIVIGLGRFGAKIAKTLTQMGCDVLAIDKDSDCVTAISKDVSHCFIADATKPDVLRDLDAQSCEHAVVAIGNNLQATILTVVNLKKLGVPNITVRADEPSHKEVLELIGANDVIIPEEESAVSLANSIISDSILDYYQITDEFAIMKLSVSEKFKARTLIDLNVRNNFDVNIVGMLNDKNEFYIPKGTDIIESGNIVYVVGKKPKIRKFEHFLNS